MSTRKILVVDDSLSFLKSVEEILQSENFLTLTASDADSAWEIYQQQSPDLVLTDVNLLSADVDDKSGFELMEKILHHQCAHNICPVILMSSDASIKTQLDQNPSDNIDFLSKPFDPEILLKKISAYTNPDS